MQHVSKQTLQIEGVLASDDSRYISGEVVGAMGGKPLH